MKATGRTYSQTVGLTGLEGYAIDGAVVRWGTAFQGAIEDATADSKSRQQAEQKADSVLRKWVPSTRRYR